ncbi:hypothetical protein Tco_0988126 [Tanacetum coccineum]|uniref:Reverse transcriptase domain-containing protein n=1 Tax=Tanacetum coccineum TaxID=301880 RepID=A0ABQ5EQA7_9ASTR
MKAITTRSGVAYEGPSIPTNPSPKKVVERETEETTDKEQTNFQGSTAHIPPPVNPIPILEPDVPKTLPKPNIPYPSKHNDQKSPFAPTIKNLLMNKEKLLELAKIPLNENCSAMLLKKLLEKLGDPDKFLIPCNFPGMDFSPLEMISPPHDSAGEIITNPSRIAREHEEYISLMWLLCGNSSSQPSENFHASPNTIIESLPIFPIPVQDSDSHREEIDIFPGPDDLIPPEIERDNYDSEDDKNSTVDEPVLLHTPFPDED